MPGYCVYCVCLCVFVLHLYAACMLLGCVTHVCVRVCLCVCTCVRVCVHVCIHVCADIGQS